MKDNSIFTRILRTSSVKGAFAMAVGSLFGQLILIAATPILSRLYPPESYGSFSVILAISAIIGPAAALKFESALLLPKDDETARRLLRAGAVSAVSVSLISGLIIWIIDSAGGGGSWAGVSFAPVWVAAMVFAVASFALLSQAALRSRSYTTVAKRSVTQSLGIVAGQLSLSVVTRSSTGLLGGFLFGRLVGFVPLIVTARTLFRKPKDGSYREVLRRYWRFPTVFTASALLNTLGSQIPLLFIAAAFGAANAGELGIAQRLIAVPVTLLGASVAEVFSAELATRVREGRSGARHIYLKSSAWMAFVGAIIAILLLILAPPILPVILGPDWKSAGAFTQAMSIYVGVGLVASPVSRVFMIFQRSRASLVVDLSRVILLAMAIGTTIMWNSNVIDSVWLIFAALTVNYILGWVYGLYIVSNAELAQKS